jgi:hypothetical protein
MSQIFDNMLFFLLFISQRKNISLEAAKKKLQKISDRLENNVIEKPQFWEQNSQHLKKKNRVNNTIIVETKNSNLFKID